MTEDGYDVGSDSKVARYRTGMANVLAKLVAATDEIERSLDVAVDGDERFPRAVLNDDPAVIFQIMCALLLRKAKLHVTAILRANQTGNVHSLAVQMRPVLECAGQIVLIFHNLIIAPERGEDEVRRYINADCYRTIMSLTTGDVGQEQLFAQISAASGMTETEVRKGKKLSHLAKVAALDGGEGWYRYLSNCFCHGRTNWRGHSWQGGVRSMNTAQDDFTRAGLMDYSANQVAVMNAYATLCPVAGEADQGRVDGALAHLREVRAASKALRDALRLAGGNPDAGESG